MAGVYSRHKRVNLDEEGMFTFPFPFPFCGLSNTVVAPTSTTYKITHKKSEV